MGKWTQIKVAGHSCDIFEPGTLNPHGYVVLYLHGVNIGRLIDRPIFGQLFDDNGLRVMAPLTQRSWWTDRICAEFDPVVTAERHILDNVVPWIVEHWSATAPRIALLGTSMGGQGALRFAFKYPDTFPIVAALSPAIDYYTRWDEGDETLPLMYPDSETIRQDTATLHVHPLYWPRNSWFCCDPTDWRWIDSSERLQMKLQALGVPHRCDLSTEAGGHGFEYYSKMAPAAMEFIMSSLETERRRVL